MLHFVSPDYLISTQIDCLNLSLNFNSSFIIPSSIPINIALCADRSWIFEFSRFSNFVLCFISSLPTIWFQPKYIALISFSISVRRLLFPCQSLLVLPSVPTVIRYLRLVCSLNLTLDLFNPTFCLIIVGMRREILVFC